MCRGGSFGPFRVRRVSSPPCHPSSPDRRPRRARRRASCVLRTYGPSYRVGRLLASTPDVSVAEARALAAGGPRYVPVEGRIDAENEFEDDAHRPLVFRRTRLQLRGRGGLASLEDGRERVPFEIREGLDGDRRRRRGARRRAGRGHPRESVGTAADVADRVPPGTPPGDAGPAADRAGLVGRARHRGRRARRSIDAGAPTMSAGLGRPLDPDHARAPGGDARSWPAASRGAGRWSLVVLVGGLVLVSAGLAWAVDRRRRREPPRGRRLGDPGGDRLAARPRRPCWPRRPSPSAGGRRRPAQLRPGPGPRRRSGLRRAGRRRDRARRRRRDPRLCPADGAGPRLTRPGPSDYWQEL